MAIVDVSIEYGHVPFLIAIMLPFSWHPYGPYILIPVFNYILLPWCENCRSRFSLGARAVVGVLVGCVYTVVICYKAIENCHYWCFESPPVVSWFIHLL